MVTIGTATAWGRFQILQYRIGTLKLPLSHMPNKYVSETKSRYVAPNVQSSANLLMLMRVVVSTAIEGFKLKLATSNVGI